MTLRSAYSSKQRHQVNFTTPGRTKQSHKKETDINNIMARFQKTGAIDFVNTRAPQYGDATGIEFQTAMETVAKANEMFADLPSKIRERFHNNAEELLFFLEKEENRTEAAMLGLLKDPAPKEPEKTPEPAKAPEAAPAAK